MNLTIYPRPVVDANLINKKHWVWIFPFFLMIIYFIFYICYHGSIILNSAEQGFYFGRSIYTYLIGVEWGF